jgi:hypothetical protein
MKKRALRRHQQWVAKLRHVRIIWASHSWPWSRTPFNSVPERLWWFSCDYRRKPWKQVSRYTMNGEPKHWQYDFNIRPSRTRQSQLVRLIERGLDPDVIGRWPDYRKPHIYYW